MPWSLVAGSITSQRLRLPASSSPPCSPRPRPRSSRPLLGGGHPVAGGPPPGQFLSIAGGPVPLVGGGGPGGAAGDEPADLSAERPARVGQVVVGHELQPVRALHPGPPYTVCARSRAYSACSTV